MGIPARQQMLSDLANRLPASMCLPHRVADLYAVADSYKLSDGEYWALLSTLRSRYQERQESTVAQRNRLVRDAAQFDFDSMSDLDRIMSPEWRMLREK